ncbi:MULTISPECIES: hypothetical protein [unclassified Microbacterium]|uniref:hypothetical protein n=1 Tax=unclassified Microbacterium TaxID=2609290 RepID=UPI00386DDCAC
MSDTHTPKRDNRLSAVIVLLSLILLALIVCAVLIFTGNMALQEQLSDAVCELRFGSDITATSLCKF